MDHWLILKGFLSVATGFPLPATCYTKGEEGAEGVRIQVRCISGPCHPPQVGGGSAVLSILRGELKFKAKVLNGFIRSYQVASEFKVYLKPAAAVSI